MDDLFSMMQHAKQKRNDSAWSSAGDPSTKLPGSNATRLMKYVDQICPKATHVHIGQFGYEALVRELILLQRYVKDTERLTHFPAMISLYRMQKKPLDVHLCTGLTNEIVLCEEGHPCPHKR